MRQPIAMSAALQQRSFDEAVILALRLASQSNLKHAILRTPEGGSIPRPLKYVMPADEQRITFVVFPALPKQRKSRRKEAK
jgi:hypothetical protein